MTMPKVKERDRHAILNALRAGVVPRVGLQHIQVGRKAEVDAILHDLDHAAGGGAAIRFVIGRFGSGKSFFLNLANTVALTKGFLVARADITTDRRLHGSGGHARALYTELMCNLASKAKPEGGALAPVLDKFLSELAQGTAAPDAAALEQALAVKLKPLQDLVGGFDIVKILAAYFRGYESGNAALQDAALRWLRGEYTTRTEARQDLGVRVIIEDVHIYDYLKLFARLARIIGYKGLVVCVDEMVVLSHRLASSRARNANYEAVLRILNDCLQSSVESLVVMFAGTDEFLEDKRRGLFSYEALATRLQKNAFAIDAAQDLAGPVIRLRSLTPNDLWVLLHRIREVFATAPGIKTSLPDDAIKLFLDHSEKTLGEDYFRTPRDTVVRFINFLDLLEQEPSTNWRALLGSAATHSVPVSSSAEANREPPPQVDDDDLVSLKI